ncbi:hypothetical protein OSB04_015245 [Centaurea solstitialis]|uniref:Myosin N-terminal SH3-like domain-containing protein n=1 Tax=Centaurea solstitialis TaxID=347529 RepID=A0AA38TAL7_9ASTR|nr:hypothetical protein OSB04_015245 [Centaurea solstitialis]
MVTNISHICEGFNNQCTVSKFYNFLFYLFFASNIMKYLQAAPVNIIVGSHVWVEDPSLAWIDGEVTKINGQELHVHTTNGKKTYTGNILIAINPFQRLPHLYDTHMMEQYKGADLENLVPMFLPLPMLHTGIINILF